MTAQEVVDRWIALLERPFEGEGLLHLDIVVRYYPMGKGRPPERILRGRDEVLAWMRRPDPGKFRYRAETPAACDNAPDLPPGELALWTRYEINHPPSGFHNQGSWTFHLTGEQIVAVLHQPEPLPDAG